MLIVKPYGRSETALDGDSRDLRRTLRLRPSDDGPHSVPEFAGSHPELVIAQWVSAIDKIACKPAGRKPPTQEQRALRGKLGGAAWNILKQEVPPERQAELDKLWWRKIHPYSEKFDKRAIGREKGRWYARFVGKTEPGAIGEAEAAEIARRIEEHLHKNEFRIGGDRPDKRQGRIAARAESIACNVAAQTGELPRAGWTDEDRDRYRDGADVAGAIRRGAEAEEEKNRRVGPAVAAKVLHAHYAKLFVGADGRPLSVAQAKEEKPGLFALHGAVREAYARVLKNHGKDRREHGTKRRQVSALLPANMDALFPLVEAMGRNRELGALVRLGKLIHYEAAPEGDEPVFAIGRWPAADKVESSRYRTSEGQAEIKRNEAFVRVWRGAVALAQRTLTDWADPDGKIDKDIFGGQSIKKAVGGGFDEDVYSAKLRLLFGSRAGIFEQQAVGSDVLRFALNGWGGLRNNAFHFKGRGGFVRALRQGLEAEQTPMSDEVSAAVRKLHRQDDAERRARLIASLRGAHVEHYFRQEQVEALLGAVAAGAAAGTSLPRFRRLLARVKNAWSQDKFRLNLPEPENRRAMEEAPGLLARYIVLKTLYERAFPAWLEERNAAALNQWIDRAATRATKAAQDINPDTDAAARMAGRIRLKDAEGIAVFTDRLAAETASEYRVQRGYHSDPDAVREQAKHLEDLRCDVVAQAFEAYLKAKGFDWRLEDPTVPPLPDKKADLEIVPPTAHDAGTSVEDWHATLYFLIHLVPVEAVAGLRHQLRKWAVLEGKADQDAEAVEGLLGLYLDMHDAKFEGGEGAVGAEAIRNLFDSESVFRHVCPETTGTDDGSHVPWRGLREMLRFGGREQRLIGVFEKFPINAGNVGALEELDAAPNGGVSPVAAAHKRRENLHTAWIKLRKNLPDEDKQAYRKALKTVVVHRHLANHVRLVNHARLHRLAMAVLARLADYASLWERDLYFATLAIIRLRGATPAEVFALDKLKSLEDGRIVDALRSRSDSESAHKVAVKAELRSLFGKDFLHENGEAGVRNGFAHFNMLLRKKNEPFNLTAAVNDARRLMAYDRKLKNAVSRSVIELLAREGLVLAWTMNGKHKLGDARLESRCAVHLADPNTTEDLHGQEFVAMAAELFGGAARPSTDATPAGKGVTERRPQSTSAQSSATSSPLPAPGGQVKAVLIEAKTNNGGWKAAVESGGRRIVGHIHNTGEVPPDAKPGREVKLVVKSANPNAASFEWLTPAVEARLAKKAGARRSGGQPGGKRQRRDDYRKGG